MLPKPPAADCWNGDRLCVRLACMAAFLMMAVEKRSSRSCMAVVNLGARLSGRGVPTRPWIDFWMLLKIWVTHPPFDVPYFFYKIASVWRYDSCGLTTLS